MQHWSRISPRLLACFRCIWFSGWIYFIYVLMQPTFLAQNEWHPQNDWLFISCVCVNGCCCCWCCCCCCCCCFCCYCCYRNVAKFLDFDKRRRRSVVGFCTHLLFSLSLNAEKTFVNANATIEFSCTHTFVFCVCYVFRQFSVFLQCSPSQALLGCYWLISEFPANAIIGTSEHTPCVENFNAAKWVEKETQFFCIVFSVV